MLLEVELFVRFSQFHVNGLHICDIAVCDVTDPVSCHLCRHRGIYAGCNNGRC